VQQEFRIVDLGNVRVTSKVFKGFGFHVRSPFSVKSRTRAWAVQTTHICFPLRVAGA
jgi:hypothetical protein